MRRAGRETPCGKQVDEWADVGASVRGRRLVRSVDSEDWANVKVRGACARPDMGCLTTRRRTMGRLRLIISANASWIVRYTVTVFQESKLPTNSAMFWTCPLRWLLFYVGCEGGCGDWDGGDVVANCA